VLGGALNSVAGGGSFIAFPALLFAGLPPISANATNSVALWPAALASVYAYRKDIDLGRRTLLVLGATSLLGGLAGALWLLHTPDATFVKELPWLLLGATVLFSAGPRVAKKLQTSGEARHALVLTAVAQLMISVYGGYFGGGMGILMLAAMPLMGMQNIHTMNGLKSILGVLINGVAVVAFIVGGAVAWGPGLAMIAGGLLGGYGGATLAKTVDPKWVRGFVASVAWAMTAYFFWRAYL
jgi:uncharacterized membrane protein YfcA